MCESSGVREYVGHFLRGSTPTSYRWCKKMRHRGGMPSKRRTSLLLEDSMAPLHDADQPGRGEDLGEMPDL